MASPTDFGGVGRNLDECSRRYVGRPGTPPKTVIAKSQNN